MRGTVDQRGERKQAGKGAGSSDGTKALGTEIGPTNGNQDHRERKDNKIYKGEQRPRIEEFRP